MTYLYNRPLSCSPLALYLDFAVLADSGKLVEGGDVDNALDYHEYCVGRSVKTKKSTIGILQTFSTVEQL